MSLIMAITGSIGSGKSTVAREMIAIADSYKISAEIINSDKIVAEIYKSGIGAKVLQDEFPSAVKGDEVSKDELKKLIKENPNTLDKLESLILPEVYKIESKLIAEYEKGGIDLIIIDSPLFLDKNRDKFADVIVVTLVDEITQKERVLAREGMTSDKFEEFLKRQLPQNEKRKRAHYVIDTGIDIADTKKQIESLIKALMMRIKG